MSNLRLVAYEDEFGAIPGEPELEWGVSRPSARSREANWRKVR